MASILAMIHGYRMEAAFGDACAFFLLHSSIPQLIEIVERRSPPFALKWALIEMRALIELRVFIEMRALVAKTY